MGILRIERLSKAVLYILLPSFLLNGVTSAGIDSLSDTDLWIGVIMAVIVSAPLTVWAIYLMRKWTIH